MRVYNVSTKIFQKLHFGGICDMMPNMISQMRVHYKKIEKVLADLPAGGESWCMWLQYQQFQVTYFQKNREAYLLLATCLSLMLAISFCFSLSSGIFVLWVLSGLLACGLIGVWYYLSLYNDLLHSLEEQTEALFEKTLSIQTKPNLTMAKYWVDLAGHFVSGWARRRRSKHE